MKKSILFFVLLLAPIQFVFAEDLVMYIDQTSYDFQVGENAIIPLGVENNHGQSVDGILQYTITQQFIQANAQVSSSNSQISSFTVDDGKQTISLDFGSANSPVTLIVNLNFNYNDGKEMNVNLGPFEINFVNDESEKNNEQNKMQGSSQEGSSLPSNSPSTPQQSLEQRLNEMLNQDYIPQDPQQRLQNNQLSQDSNALKQEIQEQLQEQNKLKQEFEKQFVSENDFQRLHQQLLNQGYNVTNANLSPISNSTGDFEVNYENQEKKWAKMQGSMVNGTLTDIQKQTQEERDILISKLKEDKTFQKYEAQLLEEGFIEQNLEFVSNKNTTSISLEYQNEEIQTASIKAEFRNNDLTDIQLEKPKQDYSDLLSLLAIIPIGILIYFLAKKLKKKDKVSKKQIIQEIAPKKFDHVLESTNLVQEAKEKFKEKQYKEAYGKVNQAIRLFLSYELDLNKEITNEDILLCLDNSKYPINEIKNCFQLSSLVEFAKYETNDIEFYEMIKIAEKMIQNKIHNEE